LPHTTICNRIIQDNNIYVFINITYWTSLKERAKKNFDKEKRQAVFLSREGVHIISEQGILKISCPIKERVEKIA